MSGHNRLTLTVEQILANEKTKTMDETLENIYSQTPLGPISKSIGSSFVGINHMQQQGMIPLNKDTFGLTFFTRPNLNLSSDNLRFSRKFSPLLSGKKNSLPRIIRCYLDPLLQRMEKPITSDFVDPNMAFIPILTNNLTSLSGWPDISVDSFTGSEGIYKETYGMADGISDYYSSFDLTANFRNVDGDPINFLIYYWLTYMSAVYIGKMTPYPENIIENTLDYNTRIWRLVLDKSKRFVTKIAACGAAFPTSVPMGAAFNFDQERPYNDSNDDISITFKCFGVMYLDPILVKEFNRTVIFFNRGLMPDLRKTHYARIPRELLPVFNNMAYPLIDPDTYELFWYVTKEKYNAMLPTIRAMIKDHAFINPDSLDNHQESVPKTSTQKPKEPIKA